MKKLIIEEDTIYEMDEECLRKKEKKFKEDFSEKKKKIQKNVTLKEYDKNKK